MMKQKIHFILMCLIIGVFITTPAWADGLDDLEGLADNAANVSESGSETGLDDLASGNDGGLDAMAESSAPEPVVSAPEPKVSFGGYLKLLGYWNQEKYSDLLWGMYQSNATKPGYSTPPDQDLSGFNNVGSRLQLKIEGYLGRHARLFSALNINYNTVGSIHDTAAAANDTGKQKAELRLVEGFVEIYEGSRTWKIGPQLVTWSYMEGMEVPTDRVNARDNSYKSTEYEDSKLPSTGVLLKQRIGGSRFEVMMIPVAKTNIGMEFQDYLYPGDEVNPPPKPNQTKWASRFSSAVGKLDWAVSYVEGTDPDADITASLSSQNTLTPLDSDDTVIALMTGQTVVYGRAYNRIQSPGLDLQYNFGSWLAKLSWVNTITEDEDGDDPLIKNSWSKYSFGGEFTVGGSTFNIYAGQHTIQDYPTDAISQSTSFMLGQIRERTDFISGHMSADFLTGNALNLVLMAANYWDEEGESVQTIVRGTMTYQIADGLEFLFGPSYMDMMDNQFTDVQTEVKYSF